MTRFRAACLGPAGFYAALAVGVIGSLTFVPTWVMADGREAPAVEATDAEPEADKPDEKQPPHLADPSAYRLHVAQDKLCNAFAIKLEPEAGDQFIDLLPEGTTEVELANPEFMFTHSKGKAPGEKASVHKIKLDQASRINQDNSPGNSDPIKGWYADGCAGLETTKFLHTPSHNATGYVLAHGKEHSLQQTLEGKLKPNTRYTFMVELFKHKNYKAPLADDLIVRLVDGDDKHLDAVEADYDITSTDPDTGFAVLLITLTTSAEQAPGDLRIHLGINAKGNYRANFDNARLWQRPVER